MFSSSSGWGHFQYHVQDKIDLGMVTINLGWKGFKVDNRATLTTSGLEQYDAGIRLRDSDTPRNALFTENRLQHGVALPKNISRQPLDWRDKIRRQNGAVLEEGDPLGGDEEDGEDDENSENPDEKPEEGESGEAEDQEDAEEKADA